MYRLIGILGIFMTAGIAYVIFTNTDRAKDSVAGAVAQEICASIKPGMTKQQISDLATGKKGWYHTLSPNDASVGADGWHSKCQCNVAFKDDAVVRVSQRFCVGINQ